MNCLNIPMKKAMLNLLDENCYIQYPHECILNSLWCHFNNHPLSCDKHYFERLIPTLRLIANVLLHHPRFTKLKPHPISRSQKSSVAIQNLAFGLRSMPKISSKDVEICCSRTILIFLMKTRRNHIDRAVTFLFLLHSACSQVCFLDLLKTEDVEFF